MLVLLKYMFHISIFSEPYIQSELALPSLERADHRLLQLLQTDATSSQIELSEATGLSRTSVWRRARELEEDGYIDARVALLNPKRLGFSIQVLLSVSMVKHSETLRKQFESHVQGQPEVMECYSVSGDRDYVLLILARDMETYNEFLNTKILDHPSVHSAASSFSLRRVKYTTRLPL